MSRTALRMLQRKIEEDITQNNVDSSIISCRAILDKYPKNFATYQLLGKAFLESPNLDLAEIVFDLILRIDPDDFVSHIGKSYVAESKGDIVGAVDSIERAFELQPANEMLQAEVKRLLKLKNGVEPAKVRLTRGSLIKMYLKGKLFSQAASEIRFAAHENPNRIDFKLNLAECFFYLNEPIQAVETCVDILSILPYCWKANKIIDDITSREDENSHANLNRNRLIELDPYYEFMLPSTKSVFDIPDVSVMFESQNPLGELSESDWKVFFETTWHEGQSGLEAPLSVEEAVTSTDIPKSTGFKNNLPSTDDSKKEVPSKSPVAEPSQASAEVSQNAPAVNSPQVPAFISSRTPADLSSKKKRFISKLRSSSPTPEQEKDIPEWILIGDISKEHKTPEIGADSTKIKEDITVEKKDSSINKIDSQSIKNEWQKEELDLKGKNFKTTPNLDDTQRITIIPDDISSKIHEAQKAVVGENYQHAVKIFRGLLYKKNNLNTVISALESIVADFPDLADFKLLLGQAYIKSGRKEEANQIFLGIRDNSSL